jgi:hypothetical protein
MQTEPLLNKHSARAVALAPLHYGTWDRERMITARRPSFYSVTIRLRWGTVLLLLALFANVCSPARAYEIDTGSIMVCDTQKQAERFVELFDGTDQIDIGAVNAEARNSTDCAMANVAFVRGADIGTVRTMSHAFRISEVLVIAVHTPSGYHAVAPARLFTLVQLREFAV